MWQIECLFANGMWYLRSVGVCFHKRKTKISLTDLYRTFSGCLNILFSNMNKAWLCVDILYWCGWWYCGFVYNVKGHITRINLNFVGTIKIGHTTTFTSYFGISFLFCLFSTRPVHNFICLRNEHIQDLCCLWTTLFIVWICLR